VETQGNLVLGLRQKIRTQCLTSKKKMQICIPEKINKIKLNHPPATHQLSFAEITYKCAKIKQMTQTFILEIRHNPA
jgi:hypothetical protein